MQNKNKIVAIGVAGLTGVIITLGLTTSNYINDLKSEIKCLEESNLEQQEQIQQMSTKISDCESKYDVLKNKIKSLEKELEEKVLPTEPLTKDGIEVKITMTFYGDFAYENGGYEGIDCNGDPLVAGTVASNYYPQGTEFEFKGQVFTVRDRGSSNFNSPNRLDVFVPRMKNESDREYQKRISYYGVRTVTMIKR